jgi:hypothetical protein
MAWVAAVDLYCERVGPGLWAEPLNALSNLGFVVVAALAGARFFRAGDAVAFAMVLLVGAIGVGSFLFHTFANSWSSLADVIPITLFIYAYLWLALRRFLGLGRAAAGAARSSCSSR